MIVKLELENIGPYTNNVVLDFRANKRDKDKKESIFILPDGEAVTKIVGIIAGNAYGKTTILDALNAVGGFIDGPIKKKAINNFRHNYDETIDDIDVEYLNNFLFKYGSLSLIPVNKSKDDNIGTIKIDMYIDSGDEYTGYYFYKLVYDNSYRKNGIIEEKLSYRKKYSSKIEKIIFNIKNNFESEVGYRIAYKANILNEVSKKNKKELEEKINYCETFFNRYIRESSTIGAENYIFPEEYIIDAISDNKDLICNFTNLADSYIKEIYIDDSDIENKKLFFDYGDYKLRYNNISTATKKLCSIATSFYKSTKRGGVFLIDELDNSLNKNIANYIIDLYNLNVKNNTSQIIFTTNNAELLNNLRRDQIFIIEREDRVNSIVKYLNFIDKENNKRSRKDWSFQKAYNENIIKNFPLEKSIDELNCFIATKL